MSPHLFASQGRHGDSTPAFKRRMTGEGTPASVRKRRRIQCSECGMVLCHTSLRKHMEMKHGNFEGRVREQLSERLFPQDEAARQRYWMAALPGECPVPDCQGRTKIPYLMRRHFVTRHPYATICIETEGEYPQCPRCGFQSAPESLQTHIGNKTCQQLERKRLERQKTRDLLQADDIFTVQDQPIETVAHFKHLGRWVTNRDHDGLAIANNIKKARQRWATLAPVLGQQGAPPKVRGLFYRATVLSVLLYGSETWCLNQTRLRPLVSFHKRVVRQISNCVGRLDPATGLWHYPPMDHAYRIAGLERIIVYIRGRRSADLMAFANGLPARIHLEAQTSRIRRQFWTEDPEALEIEEGGCFVLPGLPWKAVS